MSLSIEDLISFEREVAEEFNTGRIKAPVHLAGGNERALMDVFQGIRKEDWVLCSWRSHYHCLLKGVPREALREAILAGRSISLCFPEQRIFSSAIVAGIIPIGVGIALDIQRSGRAEHVYCFVGDMSAETGTFSECHRYARALELPLTYVVEDNDRSIGSPTREVWRTERLSFEDLNDRHVRTYRHENPWPHAGAGQRVRF